MPAPRKFTKAEGKRIARILKLEPGSKTAAYWVDCIEMFLATLRNGESKALQLVRRWDKGRGRPPELGFRYLEVYFLASIYLGCTECVPANSKRGAFYELVRECLGLSDPSRYMTEIRRRGTKLLKMRQTRLP